MANEIMEELDVEEVEADQYLVFRVKEQEFGIQAMWIQEISRVMATTPVPNAPPYVEGILDLRGRLVSVINFRQKFGFERKENDEDTRIIIVKKDGFPFGVVVDSVEDVIKIREKVVEKLPETTITAMSKETVTGVGMLEDRLIILLDVDALLDRAEIGTLGEAGGESVFETVQRHAEQDEDVETTVARRRQAPRKPRRKAG